MRGLPSQNLSYTLANYAQHLRTEDGKVPERYLKVRYVRYPATSTS